MKEILKEIKKLEIQMKKNHSKAIKDGDELQVNEIFSLYSELKKMKKEVLENIENEKALKQWKKRIEKGMKEGA